MTLVPLSDTVVANDTYTYSPEDYNADGFSSVSLTVSVPPPTPTPSPAIIRYIYSNSQHRPLNSFTYTTVTVNPQVRPSYSIVIIYQALTSWTCTIYTNSPQSDITRSISCPANSYYLVFLSSSNSVPVYFEDGDQEYVFAFQDTVTSPTDSTTTSVSVYPKYITFDFS